MTIEEKETEMTKRVKEKLDNINYRITSIMTHFSPNCLLRDGTYKDAFITSFTEPLLGSQNSIISDSDTLEMLYIWTGPMNFVEIADFFKH